MSTPNISIRLKSVHDIVEGTERLNELLHNAEFAVNTMKKILVVFPDPSLYLALIQLSTYLMEDKNIMKIVEEEIGEDFPRNEALYPFFLLYCSIIIYVEYVRIQGSQLMEVEENNV